MFVKYKSKIFISKHQLHESSTISRMIINYIEISIDYFYSFINILSF